MLFSGLPIRLLKNVFSEAFLCKSRGISVASTQFFNVDIDQTKTIATLTMRSDPVNSFTLPFLTDFLIHLEKLENNKDIRAVILTSSINGVFSGGVDISELHSPQEERLRAFYKSFQEAWVKLFGSTKITIAAITGRAVAGGCALAMSCDYRISVPLDKSYNIAAGRIGLLTPPWIYDTLIHNVGTRKTELILQSANSYSSKTALSMGIIDEIADTPEDVLSRSTEIAKEWMKSPSYSHQIIKTSLRGAIIDKFYAGRNEDRDAFCSHVMLDSIQQTIQRFVKASKKSKK